MPRTDTEEMLIIDRALGQFLKAMRERLREKMKEGFRGWDDPEKRSFLEQELMEGAQDIFYYRDGEPPSKLLDVANFAMFLWWQDRERDRKAKLEEDDHDPTS